MATLEGGDKLKATLAALAAKVSKPGTLNVGFLEGATYSKTGKPVAYIAAIQEYGGTFNHPGGTRYITDAVINKRTLQVGTRFVGADFVGETEVTKAHKITIPPRPFFRTMIAENSPQWGETLGKQLVATNYNVNRSLRLMGTEMKGQLQDSIRNWSTPSNAPSTIRKKGFNDPLIDSGEMLNAVDFEVKS